MCKVGRVDGGRWRGGGVGGAGEESRQERFPGIAWSLGGLGCTWLASRPNVSKCQLVSLIRCPATQESGRHFFFFLNATPESIKIQ